MGNAQRAVPAKFDRASQSRRSMIAKINVAKGQLGMIEDDYRQLLLDTTRHLSLRDCTDGQLAEMIDALKAKGFRPLPNRAAPRAAQHPMARKARALRISLHHLNVVHNPGEPALEAFARRQLACEHFAWAKQSDAFRLIEALKNMAARNGWAQVDHKGKGLQPRGLQEGLCMAILQRLKDAKAIPEEWTLDAAGHRLLGFTKLDGFAWTAEDFGRLAAGLGSRLRAATLPSGVDA